MPCNEGIDPADFASGVADPIDEPEDPPEISIGNINAVKDPDGQIYARFPIYVTNVSFIDDIEFHYATANGTALAGTHYVSESSDVTVVAGDTTNEIEVIVNKGSPLFSGKKTFVINLTAPVNCTIADAQGEATINYDFLNHGTDPDPDPDPVDPSIYTWWAQNVAYNQFNSNETYDYACTAYAGAALMSALRAHAGHGNARFDAKKLFTDSGHSVCNDGSGCHGWSWQPVLNEMGGPTGAHPGRKGVKLIDDTATGQFACEWREPDNPGHYKIRNLRELGGGGQTMAQVKTKIKNAIRDNGAVYVASIFYGSSFTGGGWNSCPDATNRVLRDFTNSNSPYGHTWIFTGWNDNKGPGGCFQIQSSHGCKWGAATDGRCWIPYSYLTPNWPGGNVNRWRYWSAEWGGAV